MFPILDLPASRIRPAGRRPVEMQKIETQEQFQAYLSRVWAPRMETENALTAFGQGKTQWGVPGFCEVCQKPATFYTDWNFSDQQTPNYRERLVCPECFLNNRQRFVMSYLNRECAAPGNRRAIYLFEQTTPFYRWALNHFAPGSVLGSEYLGIQLASGTVLNGLRHEDAMQLSFADASLDVIVSNDVLEHVPVYELALAESARVLRENGKLIFSIPFYSNQTANVPRARLENGNLRILLPEQHHGPCLVFHDYGWDLLPACRRAGFRQAYLLMYYSLDCGYWGNGHQFIFIAEK
jgi:SAM-dependent methyltransferase